MPTKQEIYRRSSWHRGNTCSFYPNPKKGDYINLTQRDIIERYIIPGWVPAVPFISKDKHITTLGSCFAQHIKEYLRIRGYSSDNNHPNAHILHYGSGMVNTFTIKQQFEWIYEDRAFPDDIWFDTPNILKIASEEAKQETKEVLDKTDVFIITLGLSEVWYNKETNDVFWKAIPGTVFDEEKHGFRITTCVENIDNLKKILSIIEKQKPTSSVIFTLSPVTLVATFRPVSCITADCVSKSILRTAVDEVVRDYQGPLSVYYWPSYEIAKEFYPGSYDQDRRHIHGEMVNTIMDTFKKYFLKE